MDDPTPHAPGGPPPSEADRIEVYRAAHRALDHAEAATTSNVVRRPHGRLGLNLAADFFWVALGHPFGWFAAMKDLINRR
jgi:hypothetical protein